MRRLQLQPSSPLPLYRQLEQQLRSAILSGDLPAGERLPGSRELAEELSVNLHTVIKAYHALEGEGWIEFRRGAGAFVLEIAAARRAQQRESELEESLRSLCQRARRVGLGREELLRAVDQAWNEETS